jgi:hypothetical protein
MISSNTSLRRVAVAAIASATALLSSVSAAQAESAAPDSVPSATAPAAPASPAPASPAPATTPAPAAPDASTKQEAATRFERAIKLYEDTDYTLALAEFERVYELVPDYRVLYNIAQVSTQLGRYARALLTFREYLKQGGASLPADRVSEVQADLATLAGRTASVRIHVNIAGAEVVMDDSVVGVSPLAVALVVDVGEHHIEVRAAGYQPQTSTLSLAGGDQRDASFTLAAEPTEKPVAESVVKKRPSASAALVPQIAHHSELRWAGWVTTGTLAAGAGVLELLGALKAHTLEEQRTTVGSTVPELDATRSSAKTYLVAADIVGGAALLTGGVSLYFQLSRSTAKEQSAPHDAALSLMLAPSRVGLAGQF